MKGHITRIDTIELVLLIQMMPKKSWKAELGNSSAGHMYHDPMYLYLYLKYFPILSFILFQKI